MPIVGLEPSCLLTLIDEWPELVPGPATTRNAIALLRIHGAPNALISRASECASMLDAQRGATLHGR